MIAQENGLLPIVTLGGVDPWNGVAQAASPHLDQRGLNKIQGALGNRAKSVVVERHYIDKDYRDTFTNFHAKKFSTPDSRCIRLHFFGAPVNHELIRDNTAVQPHFLGYVVVRPTRPNCIGRTLLAPMACGVTDCYLSLCKEEVSIQGTVLTVEGFPFISQDADVTACAQSALWMLARYFSNRYHVYPEIYPFRLTALTKDYSIGRLVPTAGLYVWQMAEALRQIGFSPVIYNRHEHGDTFEHLMYTYVESGIPILAAFDNHVVTLFGHRSAFSGQPAPQTMCGQFTFSSEFNCAFFGNDDNAVPYQTLSCHGSMARNIDKVERFIAALPDRVFLRAEGFQALLMQVLLGPDVGFQALSPIISRQKPVLRLFLTTGRSFKKRIAVRRMGNSLVADVYRNLPLPHFIWVCEISHAGLYPAKIMGEVIWDATRNAHERDGWIAVHYPEVLVVDEGAALNEPQNLVKFSLASAFGYPIFENNLRNL